MTVAFLCLAAVFAATAPSPPLADVSVRAGSESWWEPIDYRSLEASVGAAVLEPITKTGLIRFRGPGNKDGKTDLSLRISIRIVGESESAFITVTMTPDPGMNAASTSASGSVRIGRLPYREMHAKMLKLAGEVGAQAADRIVKTLKDLAAQGQAVPQEKPDENTPFVKAPPLFIPPAAVKATSKDLQIFMSPKAPAGERMAALRVLTPEIEKDNQVRREVGRCLLEEKSASLRMECAKAIRFAVRDHMAIQDLVIASMAREQDRQILDVVVNASAMIGAPARDQAAQAWLGLLAGCNKTGEMVLFRVTDLIRGEGDPPNLDTALARCLANPLVLGSGAKKTALSLARELPERRLRKVLWSYVTGGLGPKESDELGTWVTALDMMMPRYGTMDPALQKALMGLYRDTTIPRVGEDTLRKLAEHGNPDADLAGLFLDAFRTAPDISISSSALTGMRRLAKNTPGVRGDLRRRLQEMYDTGGYAKPADFTRQHLEDLIKELAR